MINYYCKIKEIEEALKNIKKDSIIKEALEYYLQVMKDERGDQLYQEYKDNNLDWNR